MEKAVDPSVLASVDAAFLWAGAGIHGRQKHTYPCVIIQVLMLQHIWLPYYHTTMVYIVYAGKAWT